MKRWIVLVLCMHGPLAAMLPPPPGGAAPNGFAFWQLCAFLRDGDKKTKARKPQQKRHSQEPSPYKKPKVEDADVVTYRDGDHVVVIVPDGHTVTVITQSRFNRAGGNARATE